jgi:hypothetical protein
MLALDGLHPLGPVPRSSLPLGPPIPRGTPGPDPSQARPPSACRV